MGLDPAISVDSVATRRAGALVSQGWILLPCAPDGRWQQKRIDSPWCATPRPFPQPARDGWNSLLSALGRAHSATFRLGNSVECATASQPVVG